MSCLRASAQFGSECTQNALFARRIGHLSRYSLATRSCALRPNARSLYSLLISPVTHLARKGWAGAPA